MEPTQRQTPPVLDPSVRALGVVSMLNDLGSEMLIRTLPLFLANVLGVRTGIIGVIEGLAESASTLLRPATGALADRWGRRKPLAVAGYALSALSRPLLAFATSWGWALAYRVTDRIGKAVRTPARDALIADLTHASHRGRAFGFNRALDEVGGVGGMLIAAAIVFATQQGSALLTAATWKWIVAFASIPGFFAVLVIARWVHEAPHHDASGQAAPGAIGTSTSPTGDSGRNSARPHVPLSALGRPFAIYLVLLVDLLARQLERRVSHVARAERGCAGGRNVSGARGLQRNDRDHLDSRAACSPIVSAAVV